MEPRRRPPPFHDRVTRQYPPDQPGAGVLGRQQQHPQVDPDHVRVVPAFVHVEGVGKAVAPPELITVLTPQSSERGP